MPYPYPIMPNLKNNFPGIQPTYQAGGPMTTKPPQNFQPKPVWGPQPVAPGDAFRPPPVVAPPVNAGGGTNTGGGMPGIPPGGGGPNQGNQQGADFNGNAGNTNYDKYADQAWRQANMGIWTQHANDLAKWLGIDNQGNKIGPQSTGPMPIDPRVGQPWFNNGKQ